MTIESSTRAPSHLSNDWNQAVSYIEMLFEEIVLGSGTCFFWSMGGQIYLVTNWHNLSGRNIHTGAPIHSQAAIPNKIRVYVHRAATQPNEDGYYEVDTVAVTMPLELGDPLAPRWLEHPQFGYRVDVAAMEFPAVPYGLAIKCVNELEADALLEPKVSQEIFVIGFPFGRISGAPAPIWKRGSIALDPTFDKENLPQMLVDTATREGMSGSVVVARHQVIGKSFPRKDGTMSPTALIAICDTVIGVYSGRQYPNLVRAQLGIVWKRRTIEEVISAKKRADLSAF